MNADLNKEYAVEESQDSIPADVLAIVLEEIAAKIREQWKNELDAELRERARKGLFKAVCS